MGMRQGSRRKPSSTKRRKPSSTKRRKRQNKKTSRQAENFFFSTSAEHTQKIGLKLMEDLYCFSPLLISIKGPVGVGKTTFIKGLVLKWLELSGESLSGHIVSPSFPIAKIYGVQKPIAHLDLYRLESFQELEEIDYETYFYEMPCCIVEWLDKFPELLKKLPKQITTIEISYGKKTSDRILQILS